MKRPLHVTSVRNDEPDLERFVASLAAVVLARMEAEDEELEGQMPPPDGEDGDE